MSLYNLFINDAYKPISSAVSRLGFTSPTNKNAMDAHRESQKMAGQYALASGAYERQRESQKKAWADAINAGSTPSQGGDYSAESSSGDGITSLDGAASDVLNGNGSTDGSNGSDGSDGGSGVSPLLQGDMTFEELVGEICNGIDLIFATKRSTVVINDYESIYAEAKYLRDHKNKTVKNEDIGLHQLEEGTYELEVLEYGFYNTVKVHYKNGVVTESYEDLVKVFGEKKIDYYEKKIDKTTAIMKAKAYLAAHIREFDMSLRANLLWEGEIDVGDIVTIENPMTMRDRNRVDVEKRDPEYYFVIGKSVEWDGESPITGTIELRYGAVSPEQREVPETGTSYSSEDSSSQSTGNVEQAVDEVGKMAAKISYSGACQTHDCVKQQQTGDCWGMSDFIACELKSRGVQAKIYEYAAIASNHRSVKYQDASGQWVRFPYREHGVSYLFRDTDGVEHGSEVSSTC